MSRIATATVLFAILITPVQAADTIGYAWRHIDLRGMGFITGVSVHPLPPHHTYLRTDVGGAYRYQPAENRWLQLCDNVVNQLESLAVDAAKPDNIYVAGEGEVYASTDAGATWTTTGLGPHGVAMNGNGQRRRGGERLAVDSAGSTTVLWYGSRDHGLWRRDADGSWAPVTGLPSGTADLGVLAVAVDDSSAANETSAQVLYVGIHSQGIWRSTDAGTSWTEMTGGLTATNEAAQMRVARDGTLYVTASQGSDDLNTRSSEVRRYRSGEWTDITPPGDKSWCGLALARDDADNLVVSSWNSTPTGWIHRSTDAGATWSEVPLNTPSVPAVWPTWHLWSWSAGLALNPSETNRLWATTGFGVLTTTELGQTEPQWSAPMQGVEELVPMRLRILPETSSGRLLIGSQDAFGYSVSVGSKATSDAVDNLIANAFGVCTGMDYCESDPNTVIVVGSSQNWKHNPFANISRDGGVTWAALPNPNPNANFNGAVDGNIAIACDDADCFVWAPSTASWLDNGKTPAGTWYTRNAGATWKRATGLPERIPPLDQFYFESEVLIADRSLAGTFYLIVSNDGIGGRSYRSTDYGATWTQRSANNALLDWSWRLKAHNPPSEPGQIWVCYANESWASAVVHRSLDGGATWTQVTGIDWASSIAFGAPAPGRSNSTAYIYGAVNGIVGVWRSDDATALPGNGGNASWVRISNATTQLRQGLCLSADPDTYGVIAFGTAGRGVQFGRPTIDLSRTISWSSPAFATAINADGSISQIPGSFSLPSPQVDQIFNFETTFPTNVQ